MFRQIYVSLLLAVFIPPSAAWALTISNTCNGLLLAVTNQQNVTIRPLESIKQLKVVTYNLENFRVGAPGAVGPTKNPKGDVVVAKDPKLVNDQINIVNTLDADIVAFEEVYDFNSLKVIDPSKYTPLMILGNDNQRNIGFGVKSDLPLYVEMETHKTVTWFDKDAKQQALLFSRDLPVILLRTAPDRDPAYIVVGNHGKSKRDRPNDKESVDLRTAQYQQAQKIIEDYQTRFPKAVILMAGDFNADVNNGPEVAPIRNLMKSPFDIKNIPQEQRITEIYFNDQEQAEFSQLDNIFISANGAAQVLSIRVVPYYDQQGREKPYPKSFQERQQNDSDHYPVELVISTASQF